MKATQMIDAIKLQYDALARNILRREPEQLPVELIRNEIATMLDDFNNGAVVHPFKIVTDGTTTEWELPVEIDVVERIILGGVLQHLDSQIDEYVD